MEIFISGGDFVTLLRDELEQNKRWLYYSLIFTFIWGMAAHGYMFMQSSFSHDSLTEFNGERFGNLLKIVTGRFLSPVNRVIFRTSMTLPWLIGILSLLWIGLSVFFTLRIFQIESPKLIFLIAGIYTANLTVSCTIATFMHDLDADMLALLFSVVAVYFWRKEKWNWILGAVCVMLSLAFYQSYITVTIVLVMFACVLDVLNERQFQKVFMEGVKAIGMLLSGGALYYVVLKFVLRITGQTLSSGATNSMDRPLGMSWSDFVYLTESAYMKYFKRMATVLSPYPVGVTATISVVLLLIVFAALAVGLWNRKIPVLQKVLCVCLVALLPFAMNLMHILTYAIAHELMRFAYWLSYLFVLLLANWLTRWLKNKNFRIMQKAMPWLSKFPEALSMLLVFVLLYSNVQVANVFYLKKDLENKGYLSLMTRIVYKMEDYNGYEPGITPVVMVGLPEQFNDTIPGFEPYTMPNGVQSSDVLTVGSRDRFEIYFDLYLNNPAVFADSAVWDQYCANPAVQEMPNYPEDGCIALIDDILVVKLGDSIY